MVEHDGIIDGGTDHTSGAETWQIEREREAGKGPLDDPEFLLWHFAVNSRQPEGLSIGREMWLQYARTLRKLLDERRAP